MLFVLPQKRVVRDCCSSDLFVRWGWWGNGTPLYRHMGYIDMLIPKGYGFSAVLVINRVSIVAILVLNRAWFLYLSLELGMLFRRGYLFIIIDYVLAAIYNR